VLRCAHPACIHVNRFYPALQLAPLGPPPHTEH
jgi:hypothetical protein